MEIDFNLNRYIKVKLNEYGLELHRKHHEEIFKNYLGKDDDFEYKPPLTDSEGFSKWQAWSFFNQFGPYLSIGMNSPIETTIKVCFENDELANNG